MTADVVDGLTGASSSAARISRRRNELEPSRVISAYPPRVADPETSLFTALSHPMDAEPVAVTRRTTLTRARESVDVDMELAELSTPQCSEAIRTTVTKANYDVSDPDLAVLEVLASTA